MSENILFTGSKDKKIKMWNIAQFCGLTCVGELAGHTSTIQSIALMGACRMISSSDDGLIILWDTASKIQIQDLNKGKELANCFIPYFNSKQLIISAYKHDRIRIWDTEKDLNYGNFREHKKTVNTLAFRGDSELVNGSEDTTIKIWDLRTKECLVTLSEHKAPIKFLFVNNKKQIVSYSTDKVIKIWE
jgi:WD40 repeat protein